MNNFIIAGNWKMNTNIETTISIIKDVASQVDKLNEVKSTIVICPPFTNIYVAAQEAKKSKHNLHVGAQNCHFEENGAFTGEISLDMLKSLNCDYVIVGHSERRAYFNETNADINKKLKAVLKNNLKVILCIGETLEDRQSHKTFDVLETQLNGCFQDIVENDMKNIIIAYEPVWAIGTGVSAKTEEIEEAHNWLRNYCEKKYANAGKTVALLYGGSLNDKNAPEILNVSNVNGGLIGGASLVPEKFVSIIKTAESLSK